jgi:hypothetical protein
MASLAIELLCASELLRSCASELLRFCASELLRFCADLLLAPMPMRPCAYAP